MKCTRCKKSRVPKGYCARCKQYEVNRNKRRRLYIVATNTNRHAAKFGVKGKVTQAQLKKLWDKQGGVCALTGRVLTIDSAELDHVVSLSVGGSNNVTNLRWLYADVNQMKGTLSDKKFIDLCREVVEANS
jgi:5-methylcytosine-specific restriction endonuclease McrA